MIPVTLFASSLADKRGRRKLLLVALAVLPVRPENLTRATTPDEPDP